MKLEQMSAVLTGASGGIGSAVARELVYGGARVLLAGRSKEALLSLARELSGGVQNRQRVDALVIDVTDESGREALRDAAEARGVNVLINNAGRAGFGPIDAMNSDDIDAVLRTNLIAPMQLTVSLLPHLRKQPRALILNVGSTLGSIGIPGFSIYGASKAGLLGFSEALRRELADSSVRVQYLAPRGVDTGFLDARAKAFNAATGARLDSAVQVAQTLVKMLQTERPLHFIGTVEPIAARLNGLFAGLLDGAFRKHRHALHAPPPSPAANGELS
jgi:short-subunit dehydrogenase